MFVNLTEVLLNEGRTVTMQIEPELAQVTVGGETYPVSGRAAVTLTITNVGKGKAEVRGEGRIAFCARCGRCLKDVEETLELVIDRTVYAPDRMPSPEDGDDQEYMNGYQMDVEELLRNEIVINWPMKILCRPDCRGICRQCGQDLNTGTCDCDTFVPDPRMAVIKDIFNGSKEV